MSLTKLMINLITKRSMNHQVSQVTSIKKYLKGKYSNLRLDFL